MEYLFELITPDMNHLADSAEPLNELADAGWEVVSLVPIKAAYRVLLKRDKDLGSAL
jgi:hypothetical protein